VILAVFYPVGELRIVGGAVLMTIALVLAYGLRRRHVRSFWPYLVGPGVLSWSALHWGGLHPALALVPIVPFFYQRDTLDAFDAWWKHPVQGVLFFFGLVNAGVSVSHVGSGTWAVLAGLLAADLGRRLLTPWAQRVLHGRPWSLPLRALTDVALIHLAIVFGGASAPFVYFQF